MGIEIERKFLVDHDKWNKLEKPQGKNYKQGYIVSDEKRTVRVRVTDTNGYITIKGKMPGNISRAEFEYEIPIADANEMLHTLTVNGTEKTRYRIPLGGFVWEVDVFKGDNHGLIVAEIELDSEEDEFEKPDWLANEVTDDTRYSNARLAVNPYNNWSHPF
jgi:adenylate cyclase